MTESTPLEAALRYAEQGHPVFLLHGINADGSCTCGRVPCPSAGKHPAVENGLRDATTDPQQIRAWWNDRPDSNIGLRCDGLLVLDFDGAPGPDWHVGFAVLGQLGDLPATRWQRTGGGGAHYFYRLPEGVEIGNSNAGLRQAGVEKVDVRGGARGYIVAAPSRHRSGELYELHDALLAEAPRWLCEVLRPPSTNAPPISSHPLAPRAAGESSYGLTALAGLLDDVSSAGPGSRNNSVNTAAFKAGQLVAGGELDEQHVASALSEAARSTGLGEHEIRATIASGLAAGTREPRSAPRSEPEAVAVEKRFPGVTLQAVLAEERVPTPWLITGLIQPSTVGTLAGPRNTLKSFFALETAFSVAAGWPLLDRFAVTERGPVSYWWEDDSRENMRSRIQQFTQGHGGAEVARAANLRLIFHLNEGLRLPRDLEHLLETIAGEEASLVVLDSLYNFLQEGIDMRGEDVLPVVSGLKGLADETGAAVLIVDHTAKPSEGNRPRGAYGSAFKEAAYRWGIISEQAGEHVSLTSFANNGRQALNRQHLHLDPDTLLLQLVDAPSNMLDDADYDDRVYAFVDEHPAGVSRTDVREGKIGKQQKVSQALDRLIEQGRVVEHQASTLGREGSARICFTDRNDPSVLRDTDE